MSKLPPINRQALGQRDSNVNLPPLASLTDLGTKKPSTASEQPRPSYLGTILNRETQTDLPHARPDVLTFVQKVEGTERKRPAPKDFKDMDDDELDEELEDLGPNLTCNQVRSRINNFIEAGEMKVGEFQKAINVSSTSYRNFMSQNGPRAGSQSECYFNAWKFFRKRELRGIVMPKKRKVAASAGATAPEPSKAEEQVQNAKSVVLDGEMEDKVPVYDTCDEIRRKIAAHLRKDGITQAQFLRDLMSQYHTETRKIQSKQLADFRGKKGPDAGNTSCIYYSSYCFFEKLRIAEKKPKSKDRLHMEEIYYPEGVDIVRPAGRGYLCASGTFPVQNKYGQVSIAYSRR